MTVADVELVCGSASFGTATPLNMNSAVDRKAEARRRDAALLIRLGHASWLPGRKVSIAVHMVQQVPDTLYAFVCR